MKACFLAPIFASGGNFSFFLTMDDCKPIVGGVFNFFDAFFDDGGVVANIADNINDVGVMFDGRFGDDLINDGNVDDNIDTAGLSICMYSFRHLIDLPV